MRLQVYWVVRPEHAKVEGALLRWGQVLRRRWKRGSHRAHDVLFHRVQMGRSALTLSLSVLPQLIPIGKQVKSSPFKQFAFKIFFFCAENSQANDFEAIPLVYINTIKLTIKGSNFFYLFTNLRLEMSCLISSRSSSLTPSCRHCFFILWMYLVTRRRMISLYWHCCDMGGFGGPFETERKSNFEQNNKTDGALTELSTEVCRPVELVSPSCETRKRQQSACEHIIHSRERKK